jgi:hypothetical protein
MKTLKILFFLCLSFGLHAQEIPRHLTEARILQENILPQNNSYRHHDRIVEWKGYNGATKYECHTDCSGLIDSLLKRSYGINETTLHSWLGGRLRPLARNYYSAFIEQRGFTRLDQVTAILPGDFIAMKFLPGAGDQAHDTGHILVVNALPKEIIQYPENTSMVRRWAVEIIDCSHGHGKEDSRYWNGQYHPGIGKGTFSLFTNRQGVIIGYSWSPAKHSKFYGSDKRPLAVGRLAARP